MKRLAGKILMLSMVSFLGGCAVGQKISYHDTALSLQASGSGRVAVASLDHRPYVKDGEKERNYVGNLRGGFGNPFNLSTESGKPLTEDINSVICASFKKKGVDCTAVAAEPSETKAQVEGKLKATGADNLFLLVINEWYSTTYQNTGLTYDLDLTLKNRQGAELAQTKQKGEDDLGGSLWSPPAHAKEAAPQAFKKKLEALLNDAQIVRSMK